MTSEERHQAAHGSAEDHLTEIAHIPDRANAEACFGKPASVGERTVIPVAEVTYGLGFGWGGGRDAKGESGSGGGGGGGSRVRGVAVIELSPDGVRIHPIRDETAIRLASIGYVTGATAILSRTLQKLIRG